MNESTYLPLVPHICISDSGQHWFRWLVAYLTPSHHLNQCWFTVNWTPRNKRRWNFNQNTNLFIHTNASENIVCEMADILSRGRWVNPKRHFQALLLYRILSRYCQRLCANAFFSRTSSLRYIYLLKYAGLIIGLRPANDRRWYVVRTSLTGWVQA